MLPAMNSKQQVVLPPRPKRSSRVLAADAGTGVLDRYGEVDEPCLTPMCEDRHDGVTPAVGCVGQG